MKKLLTIISTLVLGITVLTGCANKNNESSTTDLIDNTSDNINSEDDHFLVSIIPQEFYFNDERYVYQQGVEINENNITDFFGYFVNREDLEKWMEIDQKSDINYVIDENNAIYHYDLSGELTNRFELFLTTNTDEIALKAHGSYESYKIMKI